VSANRFAGKSLTEAVDELLRLKATAVRRSIDAAACGTRDDHSAFHKAAEDLGSAECEFAEAFEPIADTIGIGETNGGAT
jgi:hypothetical protein